MSGYVQLRDRVAEAFDAARIHELRDAVIAVLDNVNPTLPRDYPYLPESDKQFWFGYVAAAAYTRRLIAAAFGVEVHE